MVNMMLETKIGEKGDDIVVIGELLDELEVL